MIRLQKRINKKKKSLILLFVNRFMKHGLKDFIYKNFLLVIIRFKNKLKVSFNLFLNRIINAITPVIQLRPKFVSGIIYMLPTPVKYYKSLSLGLTWLIKAIKARREYEFRYRLLFEFRDILNNRGLTISYKRDYYKLALNNRAFLFKFRNK